MVYDVLDVMNFKVKKYEPVLKQRYKECDEGGHLNPDDKKNKCEYCFRRLDYGDNKGYGLGAIQLGEKGNGLKMLVKENDPEFYKRYLKSFSSSSRLIELIVK